MSEALRSRRRASDCHAVGKRFAPAPLWAWLTRQEKRLAQEGDYFRVDIPGPGPSIGGGYDWVRVETIEDLTNPAGEEESFGMKVRPSAAPGGDSGHTAHFFTGDATSTFLVRRIGNKVMATYHGRNELPNTSTGETKDNIRNSVIAMGAFVGLSELQWSTLIKSFLEDEIGG